MRILKWSINEQGLMSDTITQFAVKIAKLGGLIKILLELESHKISFKSRFLDILSGESVVLRISRLCRIEQLTPL